MGQGKKAFMPPYMSFSSSMSQSLNSDAFPSPPASGMLPTMMSLKTNPSFQLSNSVSLTGVDITRIPEFNTFTHASHTPNVPGRYEDRHRPMSYNGIPHDLMPLVPMAPPP